MRHKRLKRLEQSEQQRRLVVAVVDGRGKSAEQVSAEVAEKEAAGCTVPVIVIDF